MNCWVKLPKGFFAQAPMEDVTDTVFRQVLAKIGKPDLFFTEFTNTDGIISKADKYIKNCLEFNKKIEKPIIAQIWGNTPENYIKSAILLKKMGFDGIDINMGCPVRKVVKHGFCSGLIDNPKLAKKLYLSAVEGANGLPVSIKTRIGTKKIVTNEWISFLLELKPAAITVHARTAAEKSQVNAHWDEFEKVVELRNKISKKTKIIANGDIFTREIGNYIINKYKVDGVMIARGMLYNPWVFNNKINLNSLTVSQRLEVLKFHVQLFINTWGNNKDFNIMRKFYKAYLNGFNGASELRQKLFNIKTQDETIKKLDELIPEYKI